MNIVWKKPDGALAVTLLSPEAAEDMAWARNNRHWLENRAEIEAEAARLRAAIEAPLLLDAGHDTEDKVGQARAAHEAAARLNQERLAVRLQELDWADQVARIESNLGADLAAHARLLQSRGNVPTDWVVVAESAALPDNRTFRDAWCIEGDRVVEDLDASRAIAHDLRRAARDAEFAPLDDQIAKRIPGIDEAAIEAQRQAIRDKYAALQEQIDAATDVAALRSVLDVK